MLATFTENGITIVVEICDIEGKNGQIGKLRDLNSQYLKNSHNKPRIFDLNKIYSIGKLKIGADINFQSRETQAIEQFENLLKKHILYDNKKLTFDDQQIKAIVTDSNSIVTARAGSGKTRVIIGKLLYELEINNANPTNLLVFCFNKNAASEVNERICNKCLIDNKSKYFNRHWNGENNFIYNRWSEK